MQSLRQCIISIFVFQFRLIDKKFADNNALPLFCPGFPELRNDAISRPFALRAPAPTPRTLRGFLWLGCCNEHRRQRRIPVDKCCDA